MNTNQRFERSTSSLSCPECGSENIHKGITPTNDEYDYECNDCLYGFDYEDTEEYLKQEQDIAKQQYQQRLDKVLSKFKDLDLLRYNWSNNLDIVYLDERFVLVCYDGNYNHTEEIIISLETVESLIKDLEELK